MQRVCAAGGCRTTVGPGKHFCAPCKKRIEEERRLSDVKPA